MKKWKIKAPAIPKSSLIVPPDLSQLDKERVVFSFAYFNPDEPDINATGRDGHYFECLLRRLRDVGQMRVSYFRTVTATNYNALRSHPINWKHPKIIRSSFKIPQRPKLDESGWQFSLSANEHGRVIGFLIDTVFHVVWLDPGHALYPWN